MKYFFDKNLLDYLSLEIKAYGKKEILNSIFNNDNIWSNINGKIVLNNQIISIIKNKYPKNSKLTYKRLFDMPGYWNNQIKNGFNTNALYNIIESLICDSINEYNLDMGVKVNNLEI